MGPVGFEVFKQVAKKIIIDETCSIAHAEIAGACASTVIPKAVVAARFRFRAYRFVTAVVDIRVFTELSPVAFGTGWGPSRFFAVAPPDVPATRVAGAAIAGIAL